MSVVLSAGSSPGKARVYHVARSRRKAAWTIDVDEWAQWDGARAMPYAINTTAIVDTDMHQGTDLNGTFLVTGVRKTLSSDETTRASLTLLRQGLINPAG